MSLATLYITNHSNQLSSFAYRLPDSAALHEVMLPANGTTAIYTGDRETLDSIIGYPRTGTPTQDKQEGNPCTYEITDEVPAELPPPVDPDLPPVESVVDLPPVESVVDLPPVPVESVVNQPATLNQQNQQNQQRRR